MQTHTTHINIHTRVQTEAIAGVLACARSQIRTLYHTTLAAPSQDSRPCHHHLLLPQGDSSPSARVWCRLAGRQLDPEVAKVSDARRIELVSIRVTRSVRV